MLHRALRARVSDVVAHASRFSAKHPQAVHALAGAGTWMVGNILTQYQSSRSRGKPGVHVNLRELAIYGGYGAILSNVGHSWYRHLHFVTRFSIGLPKLPMIGAKLAADMLLFNPVHITALILWTHTLRQRPFDELEGEFRKEWLPMFGAEAAIWTPVQLVNFMFVPVRHQQMLVNIMAIVEAGVMSWLSQLDEEDKKELAEKLPVPLPTH